MARRSVFISYAHADRADVEASAALLRAGGVRIFINVAGIEYGDRWQETLQRALDQCERVMIFWSFAAYASAWVDREWRYALAHGKRIVPTLLDATPLPAELGDFQALKRYQTPLSAAATSGPTPRAHAAHRFAIVATSAALATTGIGAAWIALSRAPAPLPPPAVVEAAPAPAPSPAASPAPSTSVSPSPAPSMAPTPSAAVDAFRRAAAAPTDPADDPLAMYLATRAVDAITAEALAQYGPRDLTRIQSEAVRAAARLQALQRGIDTREITPSRGELAAFAGLRRAVDAAAHRVAAAASVASPAPPPTPAVENDLPGFDPTSTLSLVVGGIGIALGLAWRWRSRRRAGAAFARAVFDA